MRLNKNYLEIQELTNDLYVRMTKIVAMLEVSEKSKIKQQILQGEKSYIIQLMPYA